jgi:tetratricopeptide (TPR) repeat protein
MVYLMQIEGQTNRKTTSTFVGEKAMATVETQTDSVSSESQVPNYESGITSYIRRAQDGLKAENYARVILEIRDALKLDPNHSTCHALLGLAYLRQNQTSMARVHINQAVKANPKDPIVIESKKELDQTLNPNIAMQGSQGKKDNKDGKNFWTLFNGKKK